MSRDSHTTAEFEPLRIEPETASDTRALTEALEYIAKGYSGTVGNCEGHSGTHCAEVARDALKKAAPQVGANPGNPGAESKPLLAPEPVGAAPCVVVPLKPTEEMKLAGAKRMHAIGDMHSFTEVEEIYLAMLAAAPSAVPAAQSPDEHWYE